MEIGESLNMVYACRDVWGRWRKRERSTGLWLDGWMRSLVHSSFPVLLVLSVSQVDPAFRSQHTAFHPVHVIALAWWTLQLLLLFCVDHIPTVNRWTDSLSQVTFVTSYRSPVARSKQASINCNNIVSWSSRIPVTHSPSASFHHE